MVAIAVWECSECGRQYRGRGAKKKAAQCVHGATTIEDLTEYTVGQTFFARRQKFQVVILEKIQFPTRGIMHAYYLVKFGKRTTRFSESTIKQALESEDWVESLKDEDV